MNHKITFQHNEISLSQFDLMLKNKVIYHIEINRCYNIHDYIKIINLNKISLDYIDFSNTNFNDNDTTLLTEYCHNLNIIKLANTDITNESLIILSKTNTNIHYLNLNDNIYLDNHIIYILDTNYYLNNLYLNNTNVDICILEYINKNMMFLEIYNCWDKTSFP